MEENNNIDKKPEENILRITDELVRQVVRTKRLIIILIFTIVIVAPVFWHFSPIVAGPPYHSFGFFSIIPAFIVLIFFIVGIRQWLILSVWTKRYRKYKERMKSVDRQLDFDERLN